VYDCVKPICCPPEYCVRDYYTHRFVPVIHPIVNINRQNIIDVPQHHYQQINRNVVVDPGYPQGYPNYQAPGYQAPGYQASGYQAPGYQAQGYQAQESPSQSFRGQGFPNRGFQGRG